MTQFKLPITYLVDKRNLPQALIADLELVSDTNNSLYNNMLSPQSTLGERTINLWGKEFTWDKSYLKETQSLLKTELPTPITDCSDIILTFDEIKNSKTKNDNDIGFYAQYQYIEWDFLRPLNKSDVIIRVLSTSPLFSFNCCEKVSKTLSSNNVTSAFANFA